MAGINSHFHGFSDQEVRRQRQHMYVQSSPARPAINRLHSVYTAPLTGGLYFQDGRAIPETFNSFVPKDVPVPEPERERIKGKHGKHWPAEIDTEKAELFKPEVFWGGELSDHYGHFLCETLSRMWALPLISPTTPILFTARNTANGPASIETPFIRSFFEALGVYHRIQMVNHSLRLKSAIVAEPALQNLYRLYPEFPRPHEAVGRSLDDGTSRSRPVYLSRSKFSGRSAGPEEAEIESYLRDRDVEIVHPELLSLSEQISIFRNAPAVIGLMGSAFHTSLFTEPGKTPVMVQFAWAKANRRFLQFDILKQTTTHYLNCTYLDGYRQGVTLDSGRTISLLRQTRVL